MSLKQTLSLLDVEQQLSWIRAEVEGASRHPLSWYLLSDDESALADQVCDTDPPPRPSGANIFSVSSLPPRHADSLRTTS